MVSSRFAAQVTVRLALLFVTLLALAYLSLDRRYLFATALVAVIALVEAWRLFGYVARSNREMGRLLDAIRYDDFQQQFAIGPGFADLKRSFDDVLARFRAVRHDREAQRRYLEALVEHVPIAIVALHPDGAVQLLNSAARRLLDATGGLTLSALDRHGATFQRDLAQSQPGGRVVTRMELGGVVRQLVVSTTQLTLDGRAFRLITLQDIQSELDSSELAAWQDMARVLSHEIMNSLTPIASLARTADEMVDELARRAHAEDELVGDIHAAIQTLARRSDGLMRFVRNYRQFTQMPPPILRPVALRDYVHRLEQLFVKEWKDRGIALHVAAPPEGITIDADDALLDQAVINLMRNAADAAASRPSPEVWLEARLNERGHAVIEIADNGPGVDEALGDKIFLPFYTTKPEGSGIGLALARQVMLVHQGAITATRRPGGGALFRLTF